MSNAPYTVSFGGHLDPAERRTLATTPIYNYAVQAWEVGHDHAHYADEDCTSAMLLCRVPANLCPEFLAEWSGGDAEHAAYELDVWQEMHGELHELASV